MIFKVDMNFIVSQQRPNNFLCFQGYITYKILVDIIFFYDHMNSGKRRLLLLNHRFSLFFNSLCTLGWHELKVDINFIVSWCKLLAKKSFYLYFIKIKSGITSQHPRNKRFPTLDNKSQWYLSRGAHKRSLEKSPFHSTLLNIL